MGEWKMGRRWSKKMEVEVEMWRGEEGCITERTGRGVKTMVKKNKEDE